MLWSAFYRQQHNLICSSRQWCCYTTMLGQPNPCIVILLLFCWVPPKREHSNVTQLNILLVLTEKVSSTRIVSAQLCQLKVGPCTLPLVGKIRDCFLEKIIAIASTCFPTYLVTYKLNLDACYTPIGVATASWENIFITQSASACLFEIV